MEKEKLWQAALAQLQLSLSRPIFSIWFSKTFIKNVSHQDNKQVVQIAVQNPFAKEKLEKNYKEQIEEILTNLNGSPCQAQFVISLGKTRIEPKDSGPLFSFDPEKERQSVLQSALTRAHLNREYTFANFAVSSTNEMAYAASTAVAKNPGRAYNPLFLYGGVGVGKTHLMQAIGIQVLGKEPQTSILYCTGEEFMNEIIEAIRGKNTGLFKKKYRNVRLLLIDDIQFIAGKDTVQEEFFHTFNAIKQLGGQIVMTSDRLPEQINGLEDRLRSRFEGGLTIDIQEPNFELRTAILLIKAKQLGQELPIEVAKLIAQQVESTRKLEGVLVRILSEKELTKNQLNVDFVQKVLGKINGSAVLSGWKKRLSPERIIKVVADYYQLKLSEIRGPRRLKHIVLPRQIAIYILRTQLGLAYQEIGRLFGGKDHTTIMHSEEKTKRLLQESTQIKEDLLSIKKRLV
jgi:chromosomal replication initiator protein